MKKALLIAISFLIVFLFAAACGSPSAEPSEAPAIEEEAAHSEITTPEKPDEITEKEPSEEKETPSSTPEGEITVHFIDVGQGDAILIQAPEQNILIDGGDRGNTVPNYLNNQGISSLDLVIGTHPHADHIGGLINVLQEFPVKEVIDPGIVHTTKTFEDYLTIIDQKDIKFTEGRAGISRNIGSGAVMEILHPSSPSSSHLNDASVVAKLTFGDISLLLTGDAEEASEREMLTQSRTQLTSTILKAGHHGSRTSTTGAFLEAVDPDAVVIMCGKDNQYGHPHEETLQKLAEAGVDIYRTDLHGTVVISTDGQTYDVNIKQPYQHTPQKVPEQAQDEPEPAPEPSDSGRFIGSTESDRYHNPNCRHAQNILPQNEIWFNSAEDAKSRGYTPCGVCKPPH